MRNENNSGYLMEKLNELQMRRYGHSTKTENLLTSGEKNSKWTDYIKIKLERMQ